MHVCRMWRGPGLGLLNPISRGESQSLRYTSILSFRPRINSLAPKRSLSMGLTILHEPHMPVGEILQGCIRILLDTDICLEPGPSGVRETQE